MDNQQPCQVYWCPLRKKNGPRRASHTSAALASDRGTDQMRIAHLTQDDQPSKSARQLDLVTKAIIAVNKARASFPVGSPDHASCERASTILGYVADDLAGVKNDGG